LDVEPSIAWLPWRLDVRHAALPATSHYIAGLPEHQRGMVERRNVFPSSMATAAHQLLQAVGIITGYQESGGTGVQLYNGNPGTLEVERPDGEPDCETVALLAQPAISCGIWCDEGALGETAAYLRDPADLRRNVHAAIQG
jgi:hypothetical protein